MRAEIWRMITLLREATGGGVASEFAQKFKFLDDHRGEIERGIVAWVNLVEVLVQGAERRHPDGHGDAKKSQVKAALHHILSSGQFQIPAVPQYLQPLVMDLVVDGSIEMLVSSISHYELWDDSLPAPASIQNRIRSLFIAVKSSTRWLWQPLAQLLIRIYIALRYRDSLSPELAEAVRDVESQGLIRNKNELFRSMAEILTFVGQHRQQVVAGCRLVFEAVHMAESFVSLPGPEKKSYARDLIMSTLEDLGFPIASGLLGAIVEAFIDAGIESAVSIFNKRAPESFKHRSQPTVLHGA